MLVASTRRVSFKDAPDLIAHATKDRVLLGLGPSRVCGIIEAPVVAIDLSGEHRARLISIAAHGDHGLNVLAQKLAEVLRARATAAPEHSG